MRGWIVMKYRNNRRVVASTKNADMNEVIVLAKALTYAFTHAEDVDNYILEDNDLGKVGVKVMEDVSAELLEKFMGVWSGKDKALIFGEI
jgi:hypothetical protein